MLCDNDWTIQFPDVNEREPFEIRPIEMSLKMSRMKYDFCRAKFPIEVGQEMKPFTRYDADPLSGYNKVDICKDGDPVQRLMFRPDWVDYGTQFTHIEFHDLHKSFGNIYIDLSKKSLRLKDVYRNFLIIAGDNLVEGLEFQLPDEQAEVLISEQQAGNPNSNTIETLEEAGEPNDPRVAADNSNVRIANGHAVVDYDNVSLEKAIADVNEKFRVKSWINEEGKMIVGLPEDPDTRHIAAANDNRVWRFKDPDISHGREQIKRAIVWGPWEDKPGVGGMDETVAEVGSWFVGGKGKADVRATGIAERTDIESGETIYVENKNAKKDSLTEVARLALIEEMKQTNKGTVELDPALSGNEISELMDLSPGQILQLVPDGSLFDNPTASSGAVGSVPDNPDAVCGDYVNNESYLVSQVEHTLTEQGDWQVYADIGMYADVPIQSSIGYFDPANEEWVNSNAITEDGELKTKGFDKIFEDGFVESII